MPAIVANFWVSLQLSQVEFECSYHEDVVEQKGRLSVHSFKKVVIPPDDIPQATIDYTRHLIMKHFFSNLNALGAYAGVTLENYRGRGVKFRLEFQPLRDYCQREVPGIWDYRLWLNKRYRIERLLISQDGHILYRGEGREHAWAAGYIKPCREGVYLDIIDDFPRRQGINSTGRVTEYFFRYGTKSLEKLRVIPERVDVLHYLNNYFDGRFHLGKE